ncbi:MAG: hypothetical protein DI630_16390 [Gordonia sp. (in: high G+C Gram-positive bacteria)]|nr:MAG: hypothetical protein DI630_16390 [Gordonia sp. (in: high G+C Gram-positive bacteria)]
MDVVDIREGLFAPSGDDWVLCAERDPVDGSVRFPPQGGAGWNAIELSPVGELFSWSKVWMPAADLEPPYYVGYVRLPEGPLVFAPLDVDVDAELHTGQPMRLEVRVSSMTFVEGGAEVRSYGFTPVEESVQ